VLNYTYLHTSVSIPHTFTVAVANMDDRDIGRAARLMLGLNTRGIIKKELTNKYTKLVKDIADGKVPFQFRDLNDQPSFADLLAPCMLLFVDCCSAGHQEHHQRR
jgi:hypothetical protein